MTLDMFHLQRGATLRGRIHAAAAGWLRPRSGGPPAHGARRGVRSGEGARAEAGGRRTSGQAQGRNTGVGRHHCGLAWRSCCRPLACAGAATVAAAQQVAKPACDRQRAQRGARARSRKLNVGHKALPYSDKHSRGLQAPRLEEPNHRNSRDSWTPGSRLLLSPGAPSPRREP